MDMMLPEIPRIYTAISEWAACLIIIITFRNRIHGKKLIGFLTLTLMAQSVFQMFSGSLPIGFWIITMSIAIFLMFLWIYMLCELSRFDAVYLCIRAFVVAEFAASLEWQVYCFLVYKGEWRPTVWLNIGCLAAVYSVVFFIIWRIEVRFKPKDKNVNVQLREVLTAGLIGIAVFTVANIGFINSNTLFSARFDSEIFIIRTLIDFSGLAVLYTYYILSAGLRDKKELDAIRYVLQHQYNQYELYKENIDLINMKYHDLKHQIQVIKAEEDLAKKEIYLSDMEKHLKIYDTRHATGNKVLDTVIINKSLVCVEHEIELTCVINGKLLEFMETMDICTIFGNALDNAIESVKQIPEKEKRMIHVTVFSKHRLLMIRVENYFNGELKDVVEGIPATTKENKDFHGYGLKSIRYTVGQYNGSVTIGQRENWFDLKILIPIPQSVKFIPFTL